MDIGFTGTRKGMSDSQKIALDHLLNAISGDVYQGDGLVFHHGGEPHSDKEAADIARGRFWATQRHRPAKKDAKHLLKRNREIVKASEFLIAAPDSLTERQRSGTWYTVRYARETEVPVIILDR